MKYDYIYSEAIDIITARKDEGTKFFSRDSVCVAVTEDGRLFSSFNETSYSEGKLITGNSELAVFKKLEEAGETNIAAMITMNCVDMVPVIPEKECVEALFKLSKYNVSTDIISPKIKYIKAKDLSEYKPDGDNSGIEILSVDITARRSDAEKKLDFQPDFNKVTDDGKKSETKFLFSMPNRNNGPAQQMQGQQPQQIYTLEDVVNQYQPVNGYNPMNASRQQSSMYVSQNGVNPQYMQQGMNPQYMQQGMNPQYMQQGMNPQYMQQGMNPQYMQQGMNPQYMQQGMNPQYMQQGMNPQYMQQGMNPQYMQQGMNPQYMQQGMNPQYMQQGMNPQYMQQGMNPQYMQTENNPYMQNVRPYNPGAAMVSQYAYSNPAPPQIQPDTPAVSDEKVNAERARAVDDALKSTMPKQEAPENVTFDTAKLNALLEDED